MLVDDQALIRTGFKMILETEDDIEVVGEASDGEQAISMTPLGSAGRRAHGRPDAENGRSGGHWPYRAGCKYPKSDRHPHHFRARRLRLRGTSCRGERIPAQELPLPKSSCMRSASSLRAMPFSLRRSPARSLKGSSVDRRIADNDVELGRLTERETEILVARHREEQFGASHPSLRWGGDYQDPRFECAHQVGAT